MLWVALAGPLTNLCLAVASAIVAKILYLLYSGLPDAFLVNAFFFPVLAMLEASIWINLVLCVFNFLPIPPLDGSRILMGVLPDEMARSYASFERYGFIVILLLAFTGVLSSLILPIIQFASNILM